MKIIIAGDGKVGLALTRLLSEEGHDLAVSYTHLNTDLYLATQRYLREAGFEILCKTEDLHAENAPDNIESEHEVMFTAQGVRTKAIIARLPAGGAEKGE